MLLASASWPCLFLIPRKFDLLLTWAVVVVVLGAWLVRIVASVHFLEETWRDFLPQYRFWKTPFFLSQFIPGISWLVFALVCVPPLRTRGKLAKGLAMAFFTLSCLYAYGCYPWNGLPFWVITPLRLATILLALLGTAFLCSLSNSHADTKIRIRLIVFTILVLFFHALILVGTRHPREQAYDLITQLHDLYNFPIGDAEQRRAFYAPADGPDETLFVHLAVRLPEDEMFATLSTTSAPFTEEQAKATEQLLANYQDIFTARDGLCLQQPTPKPMRVFGEYHRQNYAYQKVLDNWQQMYQTRFRLALYRQNPQEALKILDMMDGLARIPAGNDIPGQFQAIRFTFSRLELLRTLLEQDLLDDTQLAKQQATLHMLERQCGESAAHAIRMYGTLLLTSQIFPSTSYQNIYSPDAQAVVRHLLAQEHLRQLRLLPQWENDLNNLDFRPQKTKQTHACPLKSFRHKQSGKQTMLWAVPILRMHCRMAWLACSVERWRLLNQGRLPDASQIPGVNAIQDVFTAKPFAYTWDDGSQSYRIQSETAENPPVKLPFSLPSWQLHHQPPVASK